MKSKEEIEQLKVEIYRGIKESIGGDYGFFSEGYDLGYTQCQEDMAAKRYTEEDIRKAIEVGVNTEAGYYPKGYSYKLGISLEDYFINSLNKQD